MSTPWEEVSGAKSFCRRLLLTQKVPIAGICFWRRKVPVAGSCFCRRLLLAQKSSCRRKLIRRRGFLAQEVGMFRKRPERWIGGRTGDCLCLIGGHESWSWAAEPSAQKVLVCSLAPERDHSQNRKWDGRMEPWRHGAWGDPLAARGSGALASLLLPLFVIPGWPGVMDWIGAWFAFALSDSHSRRDPLDGTGNVCWIRSFFFFPLLRKGRHNWSWCQSTF